MTSKNPKKSLYGLELEMLRAHRGTLSQTAYNQCFGNPLTHPHYTLDFAQAQLEMITHPQPRSCLALSELRELIGYAVRNLGDERFWPSSMPPALPPYDSSIIADFGPSIQGQRKRLYRKGLVHRYGYATQMICGLHYNLSFDKAWMRAEHAASNSPLSLQDYTSERYLGLMRNVIRRTYLLVYLFGASPLADPSQIDQKLHPDATSLRMSPHGYHSKDQCQYQINTNSLDQYIRSFEKALSTHCPAFENIPEQLNSNVLQIENELYVPIRAKNHTAKGKATLDAIRSHGITYVELRTLDINPFSLTCLELEDLEFLDLFLADALIADSPPLTCEEQKAARADQHLVSLEGLNPDLKLTSGRLFRDKALAHLRAMQARAPKDKKALFERQIERVLSPEKTLAAKVKAACKEAGGYAAFCQKQAELLSNHYNAITSPRDAHLAQQAEESIARERYALPGYEHLEKSTQALIREAQSQGIVVDVIDPSENFIKLERAGHVEWVQQATKTRLDKYVVPLMMNNKIVSKNILKEAGLPIASGASYMSVDAALDDYSAYANQRCVVKPSTTNFGAGIAFIEPGDQLSYTRAVRAAFRLAPSILIEAFHPGEEHRFLVMGDEVIGVVQRKPAHVTGNGRDTIETLVRKKNNDPLNYKDSKTRIRLGKTEKAVLQEQSLTPKSIPDEGQLVMLRHNSNVSTGGDSIDCTDAVHPDYSMIAIAAARAFGAVICGVDILIENPTEPDSPCCIIEINHNPMLALHEFPTKGTPRNTAKPLLRLLGF